MTRAAMGSTVTVQYVGTLDNGRIFDATSDEEPLVFTIGNGQVFPALEAAVIGVSDEVLGQAVKAFVVLEAGARMEAAQVVRECQKRLEPFMVPKEVVFVPELPKTTTGKIKKTGLV